MPLADRLQIGVAVVLVGVVLVGLFRRGRAASCWSFVAYLCVVAISDALVALWPDRFWRRDIWVIKESVLNLLKLAIAVELMVRIFGDFPSAFASARRAMVVVTLGIVVLVGLSLSGGTGYEQVVGRLHPHVNDGTVWLLVAVGGYSVWYHLPLDALHKAILIGLVPFLLVYSVVQRTVAALGWERGDIFNTSAPIAYLFVLVYWAYVAWERTAGHDSGQRISDLMQSKSRERTPVA